MYQALYRKYRPKTLSEVYGQEVITKTLLNQITNNKISHAYIFSGPRGTGKTSIAKIFGKMINCENLIKNSVCGQCVSCTQNNNGQNTDIIEIDAASNNGVDEVRELRNKITLIPSYGKYKVYIIDEVHMMTTSAFNALLKILEEPPVHVVFILATTDLQKLPATVLSRCQLFEFKKISNNNIVSNLQKVSQLEKIIIEEAALLEIAKMSKGAMRDALGTLDQASAYCSGKVTINDIKMLGGTLTDDELDLLVSQIFNKEINKIYESVNIYFDSGKNLSLVSEELINRLKNIVFYQYGIKENEIKYKDFMNVDQSKILEMINIINKSLYDMQKTDNLKLQFELMLIQLLSVFPGKESIVNVLPEELKKLKVEELPKQTIAIEKTTKLKKIIDLEDQKEITTSCEITFDKIKNKRIGNALSSLEKIKMKELISSLEEIKTYLGNAKYKKIASLLADGAIKAYGSEYIVFVYEDKYTSDLFNYNIIQIEELIYKITNLNYKVISTDKECWDSIKKEFNTKNTAYIYEPEEEDINKILINLMENKDCDEMTNMFGNVVKYNKE